MMTWTMLFSIDWNDKESYGKAIKQALKKVIGKTLIRDDMVVRLMKTK